jgi:hypothetical protein
MRPVDLAEYATQALVYTFAHNNVDITLENSDNFRLTFWRGTQAVNGSRL